MKNELEIIDIKSQDELESYTLLELSDKDAYLLATSAKQFDKKGNVVTINYQSGDETDSMFKAIAKKHKETNTDNFIDVSKKYTIDKDIVIPGTSVFIRDAKKHVIRVARRTTTNDKEGSINRLFVTNDIRDKFFDDVRKGAIHTANSKVWALDTRDSKEYEYWSKYMNTQYLVIMDKIQGNKKGKKNASK